MVGPTMNLISGTHHSCERRKYTFMILWKYTIIFLLMNLATLKIGVASHSKVEKVSDSKLLVSFNSILIGVSIVS